MHADLSPSHLTLKIGNAPMRLTSTTKKKVILFQDRRLKWKRKLFGLAPTHACLIVCYFNVVAP